MNIYCVHAKIHVSNTDGRFWTHPCPIFSNRVYFFLGSPTLTIVPELEEGQRKKRKNFYHSSFKDLQENKMIINKNKNQALTES